LEQPTISADSVYRLVYCRSLFHH